MNDISYYSKAISRYLAVTHDKCDRQTNEFYENVIVFLEKEIDSYRDKIKRMESYIDGINTRYWERTAYAITEQLKGWKKEIEQHVTITDEFSEGVPNAVRKLYNKYEDLCGRVEQLGGMVENKMDQSSDGGCVTIKNTSCYQDFIGILLANGYFVCSHIDDENNGETITIEFWRA